MLKKDRITQFVTIMQKIRQFLNYTGIPVHKNETVPHITGILKNETANHIFHKLSCSKTFIVSHVVPKVIP